MFRQAVDFTIHVGSNELVYLINNARASVPYGRDPSKLIPINVSFKSLYSMIIVEGLSGERLQFKVYSFGISGEGLSKFVLDFSSVREWAILENDVDAITVMHGVCQVEMDESCHGNGCQIAKKLSASDIGQIRETLKDIISLYPSCVTSIESVNFVSREEYVD